MSSRKQAAPSGPPEWIVTFADLMSLLLCFFILIVSFSVQDDQKAQRVAGSFREQFGVMPTPRRAGIIELEGLPVRDSLRDVSPSPQRNDSPGSVRRSEEGERQGQEITTDPQDRARIEQERRFATAAATLRQALQSMPEVAALNQNIIFEETREGLALHIVDQDYRPMFPPGSRFPFERTRLALQAIGPMLARLPNQVTIRGHTSTDRSGTRPGYDLWDLSSDRANSVRRVLMESGLRATRISQVVGRGDAEPLFPQDPMAATNSRVTILLMPDAPPVPGRLLR